MNSATRTTPRSGAGRNRPGRRSSRSPRTAARRKKMPITAPNVTSSMIATLPLPSSTPSSAACSPAERTSHRRPDDQRLVEDDKAAHERQLRDPRAVEARVEALLGPDDVAVGVAQGDRDRVATAHEHALDERLSAVRVPSHRGKSTRCPPAHPCADGPARPARCARPAARAGSPGSGLPPATAHLADEWPRRERADPPAGARRGSGEAAPRSHCRNR